MQELEASQKFLEENVFIDQKAFSMGGGGGVHFDPGHDFYTHPSFIPPPPLEGFFQGGGGGEESWPPMTNHQFSAGSQK